MCSFLIMYVCVSYIFYNNVLPCSRIICWWSSAATVSEFLVWISCFDVILCSCMRIFSYTFPLDGFFMCPFFPSLWSSQFMFKGSLCGISCSIEAFLVVVRELIHMPFSMNLIIYIFTYFSFWGFLPNCQQAFFRIYDSERVDPWLPMFLVTYSLFFNNFPLHSFHWTLRVFCSKSSSDTPNVTQTNVTKLSLTPTNIIQPNLTPYTKESILWKPHSIL